MAEYIEREAARPDVFCIGVSCQDCPFLKSPLYGGCRIDDFIASIPAADVRPVVQGKWIKYYPHNSDMLTCSECEKYWILDGDQYDFHFCPNCGAKMDEVEE